MEIQAITKIKLKSGEILSGDVEKLKVSDFLTVKDGIAILNKAIKNKKKYISSFILTVNGEKQPVNAENIDLINIEKLG